MTKYDVFTSRDTTHDGPQHYGTVVAVDAMGEESEEFAPIYSTTWYATDEEADRDARAWLLANKGCRPVSDEA